jgi:hypothetical protein
MENVCAHRFGHKEQIVHDAYDIVTKPFVGADLTLSG